MEFGAHPWKQYGGQMIRAHSYQLISACSLAFLLWMISY